MAKIIMKRVPQKIDRGIQHKVMKNWSAAIVENHTSYYEKDIKIISGRKLSQKEK